MVTPLEIESDISPTCAAVPGRNSDPIAEPLAREERTSAAFHTDGEIGHEPRDQVTASCLKTSRLETWTISAPTPPVQTIQEWHGPGLPEPLPSEHAPLRRTEAETRTRRIEIEHGTPSRRNEASAAWPDVHTSSAIYAKRFASPAGRYLLQVQTSIVRDMVSPWPGASILDIGGGHGQIATPLTADGYKVTVLASSDSAFERLKSQSGTTIECVSGDLLNPPFADKSFDVVTAIRLMAHLKEWPQLVEAACRIARIAVVLDFANPSGANRLANAFFPAKKWLEGDTRHFTVIESEAVRDAFAGSGFRIDRSIGQFVFPMAVHRAINTPVVSRTIEATASAIPYAASRANPILALAVPL